MKNKIITLLAITMLINLFSGFCVSAAVDSIGDTVYFVNCVEKSPEITNDNGSMGDIAKRTYMKFRVNLGDTGASKLTVSYGATVANKTVYVYVDDMNKSDPDLSFKTVSTGDKYNYVPAEFELDNTVFSPGEHDIYFYFTANSIGINIGDARHFREQLRRCIDSDEVLIRMILGTVDNRADLVFLPFGTNTA